MTAISLTLLLLTFNLFCSSLVIGQTTDCPLSADIDLAGDGSFLLRQVINPSTSTVSVELEYVGTAWVAIAFSLTKKMTPNTAIIGLPDEQTVQKYDLTAETLSGVVPSSADRQTLMETSIVQDGTSTILKFTRALEETNETSVVEGSNMINVAYGSSNTLAMHVFSLPTTADFTACAQAAPTSTPVAAPVAVPLAVTVAAPSEVPVTAPVQVPTEVPLTTPVQAPSEVPFTTPVQDPTEVPVEIPVQALVAPVAAPMTVTAPGRVPVKSPVQAPAPTSASRAPTLSTTSWYMMVCIFSSTLIFFL